MVCSEKRKKGYRAELQNQLQRWEQKEERDREGPPAT